jgi:hypothetical protein
MRLLLLPSSKQQLQGRVALWEGCTQVLLLLLCDLRWCLQVTDGPLLLLLW